MCLLKSLRNSEWVSSTLGGIKPGTSGMRSRSAKCRCGTFYQRNGLTPATFTLNTASFRSTKLGLMPHDMFLSSLWSSEQAKKKKKRTELRCSGLLPLLAAEQPRRTQFSSTRRKPEITQTKMVFLSCSF
jgi:hypothetical protein